MTSAAVGYTTMRTMTAAASRTAGDVVPSGVTASTVSFAMSHSPKLPQLGSQYDHQRTPANSPRSNTASAHA